MSAVSLVDGQYEIGDFLFGEDGTNSPPYRVEEMTPDSPDSENNDVGNPEEDGLRMGSEYRRGRLITFKMNVLTQGSALDALDSLEDAWGGDEYRFDSESYTTLRMKRGGRTRRMYGRPRRFSATTKRSTSGWVPVTADFQCIHHHYYDDLPKEVTVGLVPPTTGGFTVPFTVPFGVTGTSGSRTGTLTVAGKKPSWPIYTIHGPITYPIIEMVGIGKIPMPISLSDTQFVVIDTRPWVRRVTRNDGVNMAGAIDVFASALKDMYIPPGIWNFLLRGIDPTGTAFLVIDWLDTHASY